MLHSLAAFHEAGPAGAAKPRLLDRVRATARLRHYSRRTEAAYVAWIRRYIFFHDKRHPAEMGAAEVTRFLSSLAVDGRVAASTQNQALGALLFLYRDVLGLDLPWLDGIVWAKRPERLPVVLTREEVAKVLRALREAVPGITRVAVLWNSSSPITPPQLKTTETAASALGIQLESLGLRTQDDFEKAFQSATQRRASALLILDDFFLTSHLTRIAALTAKARLPALAGVTGFAEAEVLISYGPNFAAVTRRSVTYVDKILKGAKPGDLPVEQPTTFELVINAKTAKALGLVMPPSLLVQANKVIQ